MTEAQFFIGAIGKTFDFVIVQDKITIRTQEIIGHKICIVRGCKNLAIQIKQFFTYLKGKTEMIEGIEFINKDK